MRAKSYEKNNPAQNIESNLAFLKSMSQGRTNRLSKLVDILEEPLNSKCDEFANKGNLYSNNSLP